MSNHNPDKEKDNTSIPPAAPPVKPPPKEVAKAPMVAKKIMKGTKEFEHHLFKLNVASMKKNISWKWKQPMIRDVEHCHWFHSLDDRTFQEEKRSQSVGGHYHEITYDFNKPDAEGKPSAVCGPPIRLDTKKLPGGRTIQVPGPVHYEAVSETGEEYVIRDTHTHSLSYEGTEMLTSAALTEIRNLERAKISSQADRGAPATQAARAQELNENGASVRPFVQE